jgi:hypothetical protein
VTKLKLFANAVAISDSTAVVGLWFSQSDAGRAYVFTNTGSAWKQVAELQGSDTIGGDNFGSSVDISGTTVVVGAPSYAGDAGRADVFTNTGGVWKQVAVLKGSDTVDGDEFGSSVAISGTAIVVGAVGHAGNAGRAYVFTDAGGVWKQVAELKGSDTVARDAFGFAVAISGTTVIVGAIGHASGGAAYVFTKTGQGWNQIAELTGSDTAAQDSFGISVSISGGVALVGAFNHADYSGRAYVFTHTASGWRQTAELKSVAHAEFGISVDIEGAIAVVGAFNVGGGAGLAYVYTETKNVWKEVAKLKGSDTTRGDAFGVSVAISGVTVVVGSQGYEEGAGSAYVFTKTAGLWKQVAELKGSDTMRGDDFSSVAISGPTAVVGAEFHDYNAGRAYVFEA